MFEAPRSVLFVRVTIVLTVAIMLSIVIVVVAVVEELNKKLGEQEEKSKFLQEKADRLSQEAADAEVTAKAIEEKLKLQIKEKVMENEKIMKEAKKEAKQLKDALNGSEKIISNLKQDLKIQEEKIKTHELSKDVSKIMKSDKGSNTESAEKEEQDSVVGKLNNTIKTLEESISKNASRTDTSINEMGKIIQDREETISQLKENSEFIDNKLMDCENEKEKVNNMAKELKKELDSAQKKLKDHLKKHQEDENEIKTLKSKYAASQLELSQMVCLNNQLKISRAEASKEAQPKPIVEEANEERNHHDGSKKGGSKVVNFGPEPSDTSHESISKLCYNEVKEKGSCRRNNCFFSHEIPTGMEQEMMINIIGQRNMCINEFNKQGSCRKKGECRFHHEITAEQRNNTFIQELMKQKQEKMRKSRDSHPSTSHNLCAYEYERIGGCPWGDKCKFMHTITDAQKSDTVLQSTMINKLEQVRSRKSPWKNNNIKNNNRLIPFQTLSKMYQLLSNNSDVVPLITTNNSQDEIEVPEQVLEKMYKMINQCKPSCF